MNDLTTLAVVALQVDNAGVQRGCYVFLEQLLSIGAATEKSTFTELIVGIIRERRCDVLSALVRNITWEVPLHGSLALTVIKSFRGAPQVSGSFQSFTASTPVKVEPLDEVDQSSSNASKVLYRFWMADCRSFTSELLDIMTKHVPETVATYLQIQIFLGNLSSAVNIRQFSSFLFPKISPYPPSNV